MVSQSRALPLLAMLAVGMPVACFLSACDAPTMARYMAGPEHRWLSRQQRAKTGLGRDLDNSLPCGHRTRPIDTPVPSGGTVAGDCGGNGRRQ